jgi:hypothetical protein
MTMVRAIVLLVLCSGLLAGSVLLFIREHGEGFEFTTRTGGPGSGARTGPNAVVETGGTLSPGASEATARAVIATVTALSGGSNPGGGSGGATPEPGANPVRVGEPIDYAGSRYTVLQVVDPEPPGFFRPLEGRRRVTMEIRQESLGQAVAYSFALFYLRDVEGMEHNWSITNGEPPFGSGSLAPGESVTGWVTFDVPQNAVPAALVVLAGIQRVVLVELR